MTRYLLTGAGGMLGTDLLEALSGREVTALDRAQLDITDRDAVRDAVAGHDIVLNTAAYTRVDDAQSHEAEARAVNAIGAENLAIASAETGARLVQFSTDYVFDGRGTVPYPETTPRDPISAYGRTKAEGEALCLAANGDRTWIVRTAWLYGAAGSNFPRTMLTLAARNETVQVVTDQLSQPTWSRDLALQVLLMLDTEVPAGIYHATNSGQATWFDLARETFAIAGLDPERVLPTTSDVFRRPAPRPGYSVLGHGGSTAAGLAEMRDWRQALRAAWEMGALS